MALCSGKKRLGGIVGWTDALDSLFHAQNYSRVVIWLIDSMILAFVESSPPQKSKTGLIASSQSALRQHDHHHWPVSAR